MCARIDEHLGCVPQGCLAELLAQPVLPARKSRGQPSSCLTLRLLPSDKGRTVRVQKLHVAKYKGQNVICSFSAIKNLTGDRVLVRAGDSN